MHSMTCLTCWLDYGKCEEQTLYKLIGNLIALLVFVLLKMEIYRFVRLILLSCHRGCNLDKYLTQVVLEYCLGLLSILGLSSGMTIMAIAWMQSVGCTEHLGSHLT